MSNITESFGFNKSAFELIRDLIHSKTGIFFDNNKLELLAEKIAYRLMENNLTNFLDYYYKLKYENEPNEWRGLIDAITVNETYFFREYAHIKILVERIIPEFFEKNPNIPLTIWSGACSTGEEPLSIVIALNEAGYLSKYPISIFASDISCTVIQKAKSGLFKERSFRALPNDLKEKYFTKKDDKFFKISEEILSKVNFINKNLMDFDELPFLYLSNIIFIKNVLIYFSEDTIRNFINFLYDKMPKGSYLFIGISESLLKYNSKFELVEFDGYFLYTKTGD